MIDQTIELPINISQALGAYTTQIRVGSEQVELHVLIDTGSSSLAIDLDKYQPETDQALKTTTYGQAVVYGAGGWAGPIINTQIELNHDQKLVLMDAPIAITSNSHSYNFNQADGIWGLAYHHLNKAYELSDYLQQQQPPLTATQPWPFYEHIKNISIEAFKKQLHAYPEHDITPLFTEFEEHSIIPNQFTLLTDRAVVFVPRTGMSQQDVAAEKINQGQFIIGNYVSKLPKKTMQVVHDAYYNVNLIGCQVTGFEYCQAPPLETAKQHSFFSNAIIDSGCSFVVLQQQLYGYVMASLTAINTDYVKQAEAAQAAFINASTYTPANLDLDLWPDISLKFNGQNGEHIELLIPPSCYWQKHAKSPGNWMFMIMQQLPHWPNQSICGLPLLNNYACQFDRSSGKEGLIHWIEKKTNVIN